MRAPSTRVKFGKAMRRGDFYASNGVTLRRVTRTEQHIGLEIEPEADVTYETQFIGTRMIDGKPGPIGKVLATSTSLTPTYKLRGDELFVRARVISSRPHPNPFAHGDMETAWVQPIRGRAATPAAQPTDGP